MNPLPKPFQKPLNQDGFILAFTLILMLFASLVIVSGIDRTGVETRIAQSQLKQASIEAAAEKGAFTLRKEAKLAGSTESEDKYSEIPNPDIVKAFEEFLSEFASSHEGAQEFMPDQQVWWRYYGQDSLQDCSKLDDEKSSARVIFQGWHGSEDRSNIISTLKLSVLLSFESDNPLKDAFEDYAVNTWGSVNLTGSGSIEGSVKADTTTLSGGASIFASEGLPVISSGQISKPDSMTLNYADPETEYEQIEPDPLELQGIIDELQVSPGDIRNLTAELDNTKIGDYGAGQVTISPLGLINDQRGGVKEFDRVKEVSMLGNEGLSLFAIDELVLGGGGHGNPTLRVAGGDVVIYVAGDVHFAGATSLKVEEGASLTLIVEGQTTVTGGFNFMNDSATHNNGLKKPIFSLYSNYDPSLPSNSDTSGVVLAGGAHIHGLVYATQSDIKISGGSYVRGQIMAANVDASGGTSVHYEDVTTNAASGSFKPGQNIEFEYDHFF